jgi:hypothetical protein
MQARRASKNVIEYRLVAIVRCLWLGDVAVCGFPLETPLVRILASP